MLFDMPQDREEGLRSWRSHRPAASGWSSPARSLGAGSTAGMKLTILSAILIGAFRPVMLFVDFNPRCNADVRRIAQLEEATPLYLTQRGTTGAPLWNRSAALSFNASSPESVGEFRFG